MAKHTYETLGFERPEDLLFETEKVSRRVYDKSRWTSTIEYVFRLEGKLYITYYEEPNTEYQDSEKYLGNEIWDAKEVMVTSYVKDES